MWADGHPSEKEIEQLLYPRACALAEVVWSPASARDFARFSDRLAIHERRLAAMGINYRSRPPVAQPK